MKDKKWKNPDKINKFIGDFEYLNGAKASLDISRLVLEVINKTGILDYFINHPADVEENISALKRLAREARDFYNSDRRATLKDFIEYLDDALENGTAILTEKSPVEKNAVRLITLHSSKGREFEYVFMPTLEDYRWERSKTDTISPKIPLSKVIDDELKEALKISEKIKLLFVGITRAKHKLFLSVPKTIGGKEKRLTRFISSIDDSFLDRQEVKYTDENYISELVKTIKYEHDYKNDFQNFIRSSLETLSISPSMLNAYLGCPRRFLYSYILRLGALNPVNDVLGYGSAVHKTIENFSKNSKLQNAYLSKEDFINEFKIQCAKTPFSDRSVRRNYLQKGEENLAKFYDYLVLTPLKNIFSTELNIEAKVGSEIKINGKIDRLEVDEDGNFIIKDFKTGAAKSAYQIKDGGIYEGYLNQLRFYKYLAEKKFDKKVANAQLVFVEQHSDNFTREMSDEDNIIIENKIKEVCSNIASQKFEPADNDKNCAYCEFKEMCTLNLL